MRTSGIWLSLPIRAAAALYLSAEPMAFGDVITFDDLPLNQAAVPSDYRGFSWRNFDYLNAVPYTLGSDANGYGAGMVSSNNVGFAFPTADPSKPSAIMRAVPFNFDSAYLTAAWNDNLRLEVRGYTGATLAYDDFYTLSAVTPLFINFGYVAVTEVDFLPFGGTHHPGYWGSGYQFAIDDISVPEPGAFMLLFLGLLFICKKSLQFPQHFAMASHRMVNGVSPGRSLKNPRNAFNPIVAKCYPCPDRPLFILAFSL